MDGSAAYAAGVDERYRGVRGWLLLLCLGLTVGAPLFTVVSLVRSYRELSPHLPQFPGLTFLLLIDAVLSLGITAYAIYAGLGLWQIRPGAVATAKRYFLWLLVYHGIAAVLPFTAGLPAEANRAMLQEVGRNILRGVVSVAVWYSYLGRSRRVKATYGGTPGA